MLMRAIVSVFGSDWKLKALCSEVRYAPLKRLLIKLYGLYQYENGSSIAWNSTFLGQPCFPHGIKSVFISGGARIGRNCIIFSAGHDRLEHDAWIERHGSSRDR